jgi:carboxyl-terminal processing protease
MRLNPLPTCSRTTLLVSAAFLAGLAIGPATDLIGRDSRAFGVHSAHAQDADRPDTYRLLTLFGDVFEQVHGKYVDPVSDSALIENAIRGMLIGLDPHSAYLDADEFHDLQEEDKGKFVGIGVEVAQESGLVKVVSSMDGTPAFRAGIRSNDIIIGLNGRSAQGLTAERVIDQIRGPPNTKITLTIERQGLQHPIEISIRRAIIYIEVVKHRLEPNNIGYLRIAEFSEPTDAALILAVRSLKQQAHGKLKALVLDLRDNPGGLVDQAVTVAREFIPKGEIVSTRARYSDDSEWLGARGKDILAGAPMVVLINSGAASASEVVAGALQDHHRAVLVGTRSFGKGSVQATIPLPEGAAMLLTIARYYTPSGRSIQGHGIVPDVLVEETPENVTQFDPQHEEDLHHTLTNAGGTPDSAAARADLPPIAMTIPSRPPSNFPKFDPAKPDSDFQLQQALVLARAMVTAQVHTTRD